ncbi:hypothetical protein JJD41_21520 [Oxynema sp. CENA135]|nr:hypothetical protein [Oxynema sp. CENA135]MBK4732422.1 hypothetical protein [Oxynema sp. CENA135]
MSILFAPCAGILADRRSPSSGDRFERERLYGIFTRRSQPLRRQALA